MRYVFRCLWTNSVVLLDLMYVGSAFHKSWAAAEKDLSRCTCVTSDKSRFLYQKFLAQNSVSLILLKDSYFLWGEFHSSQFNAQSILRSTKHFKYSLSVIRLGYVSDIMVGYVCEALCFNALRQSTIK
jgi:hypothetical protein